MYLGILALGLKVALDTALDCPVELCWLGEDGQFVRDECTNIVLPIRLERRRFQKVSKGCCTK